MTRMTPLLERNERFAATYTTFIEVSRFVDPEWLVEFELDAIVPD